MKASHSPAEQPDLGTYLKEVQTRFNAELEKRLTAFDSGISKAISYSLFLPSKRMRPIFCLETCRALSGRQEAAYAAAIALEMIHTYSLIHDDLPAMDNDDIRRGQPTNHKVYGEARAILAGDGLLTLAFQVLAEDESLSAETRVALVRELSRASGIEGMVLGQDLDIERNISRIEDLEALHRKKTGALLSASVLMGAISAQCEPKLFMRLSEFASDMGLAFQIRDDILDVEGGAEIGKPVRSDERNDKKTYVSFLGLDAAKAAQKKWTDSALETLNSIEFPYPNQLEQLTRYVVERHR